MMVNYLSSAAWALRVSRVWAWALFAMPGSNVRRSAVPELARRRRGPELLRNLCLLLSSISNCVDDTKVWMADNKIKFNDPKSDALVVYSKTSRKKPADLPLAIGEASIHPSDSVRNLGVTIDKHLTMQQQIGTTCRNAFYQLRRIVRIRKFLSRCVYPTSLCLCSVSDRLWKLSSGWPSCHPIGASQKGPVCCCSCHNRCSSS